MNDERIGKMENFDTQALEGYFWDTLSNGTTFQLTLVLSIIIGSVALKMFTSSFGEILGIHKLLIISILGVFTSVGVAYLQGGSLLKALFDAKSVIAFQLAIHQVMIQIQKIKSDAQEIKSKQTLSTGSINSNSHPDIDSTRM